MPGSVESSTTSPSGERTGQLSASLAYLLETNGNLTISDHLMACAGWMYFVSADSQRKKVLRDNDFLRNPFKGGAFVMVSRAFRGIELDELGDRLNRTIEALEWLMGGKRGTISEQVKSSAVDLLVGYARQYFK